MGEYIIRYPYRFDEREKPYFDEFEAECRAINRRGSLNVAALIAGDTELGEQGFCGVVHASEDMVRYCNKKYDPENPIFNDEAYARAAGYDGLPAMAGFAACDENFMRPVPEGARDRLTVSGLNHSIDVLAPIYAGDTLYLVTDSREFFDLTPESGSEFRSIAIESRGSVYNQRGERVQSVIFRVTENLRTYADGRRPASFDAWDAPDWRRREDHYYTDADWEKMRDIWAHERVRGAQPLFWEDVAVGFRPPATLDGPVDDCIEPAEPWGMGVGGSRTLKREIMTPEIFAEMRRNPYDGIYRMPRRSYAFPEYPASAYDYKYDAELGRGETSFTASDDPMSPPPERFVFINFMGRDYALRHIQDWMGDRGRIKNISWGIMPSECMAHYGYRVPADPRAVRFLDAVEGMSRRCLHHGVERDAAIVRSVVTEKGVSGGEPWVKLVWWVETVTGDVYEEGGAVVALPPKIK